MAVAGFKSVFITLNRTYPPIAATATRTLKILQTLELPRIKPTGRIAGGTG
jgi:hypothetical protein